MEKSGAQDRAALRPLRWRPSVVTAPLARTATGGHGAVHACACAYRCNRARQRTCSAEFFSALFAVRAVPDEQATGLDTPGPDLRPMVDRPPTLSACCRLARKTAAPVQLICPCVVGRKDLMTKFYPAAVGDTTRTRGSDKVFVGKMVQA